MSSNLVSMDNLQSILEPIGKNIIFRINDKDISDVQKEKLNKTDIIDITTNSNSFLSNNGKYNNISINNINDSISKMNNVYDIFKIKENNIEEWSVCNPMPTMRYNLTSQIYKDKIYCIGGYTNSLSNILEIYDIKNDIWTIGANMPTPREALSSCICNDKIYVIGGNNNILEIYDISNNTWTTGANMLTPRTSFTSCIYDNKIYVIGGYFGSYLSIEIYDIFKNTWERSYGKDLPTKRSKLTSCIYNNKIYVIGGNNNQDLNIVEIYDISNDIWNVGKPMITKRKELTSQIYNNKIYCIGGNNNDKILNIVEIYDISNDIWNVGKPMITGRYRLTSQIYNNKIYCIAGYNNGKNNLNEVLSLAYTDYDITLSSDIQNKLDCINNTGIGTKILSDRGEYINIPKGYRFMESNEVTDFIEKIKTSLNS